MKGLSLFSICFLCACMQSSQETILTKEYEEIIVSNIDQAQMRLIPAGTFLMGNADKNKGDQDEYPVHEVFIDAFYIDIYEVTNSQYQKFVSATGYGSPPLWHDTRFNKPEHPVVNVSWHDAVAYANWANKRLPTEAEWEYTARGNLIGKTYLSGDIISRNDANYASIEGQDTWKWTAPVGSFQPNGFGLYDMAGNVWEWCFDVYKSDFYSMSPSNNPRYGSSFVPKNENFRVLRGGGWGSIRDDLRISNRWYHLTSESSVGFRCVKDIEK